MFEALERKQVRHRSDYTYKFNANTGRHGWLRFTPAYSLKIVEELITARRKRAGVTGLMGFTGLMRNVFLATSCLRHSSQ